MFKRSRYSLILIAALSSLVIVSSAQDAQQQVTNWGVDNGYNGRFEVAATNPTTGAIFPSGCQLQVLTSESALVFGYPVKSGPNSGESRRRTH
jgi:hypothetical protein